MSKISQIEHPRIYTVLSDVVTVTAQLSLEKTLCLVPQRVPKSEKVLGYTDRAGSTHAVCAGDVEDPGEDGAGV